MAQPPIAYTLIRSTRKTAAIQINPAGEIIVRAPNRMPLTAIESFLREKSAWIDKALLRMHMLAEQRVCASAQPGGTLWFLGEPYPVIPQDGKNGKPTVPIWDGHAFSLPRQGSANAAVAFFKAQAQKYLSIRTAVFAKTAGINFNGFTIGSARSRWGSCSPDNSLRFSWRLLCTPPAAVDYVVAHELAHVRHHDHSHAFWQEVARIWPEWNTGANALRAFERHVDLSAL
ncbi:M48 family metallopeptidase [Ethanoligenens sp.]|uniref:M48 family metallopeptidase n=1 Tax=Ethanoligenens sp. TaxID=2099655 RepID=UPI0039E8BA6E